jgi:hypothetical protein
VAELGARFQSASAEPYYSLASEGEQTRRTMLRLWWVIWKMQEHNAQHGVGSL